MKVSEIPVGEGRTGTIGTQPVAIYNDGGTLVVLQNICTHRGCRPGWNDDEKTWDCPCHGSRFHADGSVLRGPAQRPLPRLGFEVRDDEIELVEAAS